MEEGMIEPISFSLKVIKQKANYGQFVISPLPRGLGQTVGNSLRRTLLSLIPGAAATQMKVAGANHIFTGIKGVKEDLVEVMLNVKQIRFIYDKDKPVVLRLEKEGPGEVKASDIKLQPGVKIANPELLIATLADKKTTFKLEITIERGVGYVSAEEHKSEKLGVIGLDSVFTPIKKVNFNVEPTRKGKSANFDKLFIEIWTDGTLDPKEALKKAAKIIAEVFQLIVNSKDARDEEITEEEFANSVDLEQDLLIEEIAEIPLRLVNALKKAGYKRVRDLVGVGREKILKTKNVGEKSVDQLIKILSKRGVEIK